ncbi:Sortase family protein [Micromonospora phaseoli]|uniref:Sortase family protein n=1 Tax=Micromonospora phaseoli TaxID=1144548 RepID=A0A1H6Y117_9ACTN|nr:class F sortase [Micromonospora phaseoli]PZV99975.1 sortase family protein [Micromonospora phaseoli]GIJ81205.1 class F sortase [Micromonospora phaseoli]SEJ34961.1 Sortase family protein [Micromonospora phaseoli]
MRAYHLGRILVALLAVAGLALVGTGLARLPVQPPQPSGDQHRAGSAPSLPPLARATPVEVRIAAIGVRAPLVPVAADETGALQVPPVDQPAVAGWYRPGVSPGETGNAVLVGHVDSRDGPAVFFDLGRLRPGDTVQITRDDASVVRFAVEGVEAYPKDRFPTDLVYGPANVAGLRLITCGGRFDRGSGDYVDNVVVFASRTT